MATLEATDVSRVQHGGRLTAIDQPGHKAVIYLHTLHRFLFSTKNSLFLGTFFSVVMCVHDMHITSYGLVPPAL
jgi:hypothetical protein